MAIKLIGGSFDGASIKVGDAPPFLEMDSSGGWVEVYERQNGQAPFLYVQIGYGRKASCE